MGKKTAIREKGKTGRVDEGTMLWADVGLIKQTKSGAGERTWWLRALAGLPEDWVQFPAPMWQHTTICNSSSRGCDTLFWPLRALHARGAQTFMQANTHTYRINKLKNSAFARW